MHIADTLSRDCHNHKPTKDEEFEVLVILPITSQAMDRLRTSTEQDESLKLVRQYVQNGWPVEQHVIPAAVKPYWNFRDEISEYDGLMFKGKKVIIPNDQKVKTISQIHAGHQGIQRTLSAARDHVFWLNMTKDITDHVEKCSVCEATQRANTKEPLINKEVPTYPFQIVATDLFTFKGHEFMVIVDSYSGFFDFRQLRHTTSKEIIEHLKSWFATHGIPAKLESDNGPQYASMEFRKFAAVWGFEHVTSSPKYPKSNGLAERFVQTAKNMLRKCSIDKSDIKLALLTYRNTPRNDGLGSPSQRLMSRTTRSLIPTHEQHLKPQVVDGVGEQLKYLREKQKVYHDRNARPASELAIGDKVRLQRGERDWIGATVKNVHNKPRSFIVETDDGREFRRNSSQLHTTRAKIETPPHIAANVSEPAAKTPKETQHNHEHRVTEDAPPTPAPPIRTFTAAPQPQVMLPNPEMAAAPAQRFTRSGREVKKVIKLNL